MTGVWTGNMAERSIFYLFRDSSLENVIAVLRQVATATHEEVLEGQAEPSTSIDYITIGRNASTKTTIFVPFRTGKMGKMCYQVSKQINDAVITIRMQEGAIWDYTLVNNGTILDCFSVAPNYWDGDDSRLSKYDGVRGNATILARTWNVPSVQFNKYMVDWGLNSDPDIGEVGFSSIQSEKAYPEDRFPFGDVRQALDFMRSLGGHVFSISEGGKLFYVPTN